MKFSRKRVLVVGDAMLDIYCAGEVRRISPEAPVPVFKKAAERFVLGGAANVAANVAAAGQDAVFATVIGDDFAAGILRDLLAERGIDSTFVISGGKPTTTKTRYIAENNQQVMRLDVEDVSPISDEERAAFLGMLKQAMNGCDVVVVSDYMKGLLDGGLIRTVVGLAREAGLEVLADVKGTDPARYAGATLLKPNASELSLLTGMPVRSLDEAVSAAHKLLDAGDVHYVLATCGARGMVLVGPGGDERQVPSEALEVFDVSGAGDTAIAYLAACRANGVPMADAVRVANVASGLQVSKAGTSSVFLDEVRAAISGASPTAERDRQVSMDEAMLIRSRNVGKKIVFTNGCFDILHVGHVRYLRHAASLGDLLVVGVNSDSSVRKIKGEYRPINPVEDRAAMLASYDFIDYVVVFDEETPYELIKALQPDVLVKGGDYAVEDIVGRDVVEARGGIVRVIPYVDGRSSTGVIDRILQMEERKRNL